jgi:hypothetical protein
MPDAPITLRLRLNPIGRSGPISTAGTGVRVRIEARDELGAPLDVTGLALWVRRPLGAVIRHEGDALRRTGVGLYSIDVTWDAVGIWTYEATCLGPREARSQPLAQRVEASRVVAAAPPPPLLITDDAEPVVLNDGHFWTARRIGQLDEVEAFEPDDRLVLTRGNRDRRIAGAVLLARAASSGANAGSAAGAVAAGQLGAEAGAQAGSASGAQAGALAGAEAGAEAATAGVESGAVKFRRRGLTGLPRRPLLDHVEAEVCLHEWLSESAPREHLYDGSGQIDGAPLLRSYLETVRQFNARTRPRGLPCRVAAGIVKLRSRDPSGGVSSNPLLDLAAGVPPQIDGGNPGQTGGYALRATDLRGWQILGDGKGRSTLQTELGVEGGRRFNYGLISLTRVANGRIAHLTLDHRTGGWANGTHLMGIVGCEGLLIEEVEALGKDDGGYVIEATGPYHDPNNGSKVALVIRGCDLYAGNNDGLDFKDRQGWEPAFWLGNHAILIESTRVYVRGTEGKAGVDIRGIGTQVIGLTVIVLPGSDKAIALRLRADGQCDDPAHGNAHRQNGGKHSHLVGVTLINKGGSRANGLVIQAPGVQVFGLTALGFDRLPVHAVLGQGRDAYLAGVRVLADRTIPLVGPEASHGMLLAEGSSVNGFTVSGAYDAGVRMRGAGGSLRDGTIEGAYTSYAQAAGSTSSVENVRSIAPIARHRHDLGQTRYAGHCPGLAPRNTLIGWNARAFGRVGVRVEGVASVQGPGGDQRMSWQLGCGTDGTTARRLFTADRSGAVKNTSEERNQLYLPFHGTGTYRVTGKAEQPKGAAIGAAGDNARWVFDLVVGKGGSESTLTIQQVGTTQIPASQQAAQFPAGVGMQIAPTSVPRDSVASANAAWLGNCRIWIERDTATGLPLFSLSAPDGRPLLGSLEIEGLESVRADTRMLDWRRQPSVSQPPGVPTTVVAWCLVDGVAVDFAVRDSGGAVVLSASVLPADGEASWTFARPATGTYTVEATATGTALGTIVSDPFTSTLMTLSLNPGPTNGAPGTKQTVTVRSASVFFGDITLTWVRSDGTIYADAEPIVIPQPEDPAANSASAEIIRPDSGLYRLRVETPYAVPFESGVISTLPNLQFNPQPAGGVRGSARNISITSSRTWYGVVTLQYVDAATLAPVGAAFTGNKAPPAGQVNIATVLPSAAGSYRVVASGDGANGATSTLLTVT